MATISLPGQLARTRRFTLGVPGQFTVTADGATVLFLRSRAGDDPVSCLWTLDLDTGAQRLLADPAELPGASAPAASGGQRGRPRTEPPEPGAGIVAYATDQAGRLAAFTLAGELWTVEVAGGQPRPLPAEGPVADPRPDPAGRRIGYVCGGALRVIEADGTGDTAIAVPDGPDVTFGIAEHTGTASLGGRRGYWWAPDGARLLIARVDSAAVGRWHAADAAEPGRPPRAVRYAAAGTANAEVTLWIAELDGSRTQARWDRVAFEYLPGAGWDAHGPYAVVQSRDQRTVRFLGIGPAGGETSVLSEQRDECWVQLVPGLPARSGSALIGHADVQGTRHLTVAGVTVTPPGLQLRAVLGVHDDEVLFTASREPAETHLWSYRAGAGLRRLSAEPGVHSGVGHGGTLVHIAGCGDQPGGRVTVLRAGKPAVPVASLAERPVLDVHATRLVLGPRELRAVLFLPSWHRPGRGPLPVLADPYGGASMQRVTAERDWRSLVSQWLAEQGFAVLVADGRGTPGRGPDWERAVHGDLFGPVLDDQVSAVQEAARLYPELDLGRVGIRGWSFGGSLAALAVLRRPDVFHAAVAGAGVTDQLLYNAFWRDRFLGHPGEFPDRYEACSLLLAAPKLTRPLLLVHGLADDNVYPANTLRLSSALLAAGCPHEVLLLPGVGRQPLGAAVTENLLWHQVQFLQRHLGVDRRRGRPDAVASWLIGVRLRGAALADADRDPRRRCRLQPPEHVQQLPGGQRHAARGGRARSDVQEDSAAQAGDAGGVVRDHRRIVVGGLIVHRLGIDPRGSPARGLLVHPLVVPGAGRIIVPDVVAVGVPPPERHARIRQHAEEEAEAISPRRRAAVTLALAARRGDAVVADPGGPRAEHADPLVTGPAVSAESRVRAGVGGGGDRDQLPGAPGYRRRNWQRGGSPGRLDGRGPGRLGRPEPGHGRQHGQRESRKPAHRTTSSLHGIHRAVTGPAAEGGWPLAVARVVPAPGRGYPGSGAIRPGPGSPRAPGRPAAPRSARSPPGRSRS